MGKHLIQEMSPHEGQIVTKPLIQIRQNIDEDQVVAEHPMQENIGEEIGLRRSSRIKKPSVSSNYIVYLQELE